MRQTQKVIHFAAFDSPHVTAALEAGGDAANEYYAVLLASAIDVAVAANANSDTDALVTNSASARVQWCAIMQDEPQSAFQVVPSANSVSKETCIDLQFLLGVCGKLGKS